MKRLVDDSGGSHGEHEVMANMVNSYFQNLFTGDDSLVQHHLLDLYDERVTSEMNDRLCAEFSEKEISDSLFQMGPLKAPGKDGFPARFFQKNWLVMKGEIIRAVQEFFRTGVMPDGVNEKVIVLIPKEPDAKDLKKFRPINLSNCGIKIFSKAMTNTVSPIGRRLISSNQTSFIKGRYILESVVCMLLMHVKIPVFL